MLTKFMLRPLSVSLPFSFLSPSRFFLKPSPILPLISSLYSSSTCSALNSSLDQAISYGPSLHKGCRPKHQSEVPIRNELQEAQLEEDDDYAIDAESFARVFDIAALRVPSEQCFALESRLRGHLLNWPRVRNIARVPGDEMEDEFKSLLKDQSSSYSDGEDGEGSLVSLNRRIYGKAEGDGEPLSPVLYRDKLARTFNTRGFVKFRNLAKLSRPKKGRKSDEGEKRVKKWTGKNGLVEVEVVEESEEDGEDLSGLLGDEFKGRKWRGSTRLLLLDERYESKSLDELPEAIKVSVPILW